MDTATQVLARGAPPGVTKSFRTLADHGDVPRTTLQHRARGRRSECGPGLEPLRHLQ
ncbi:hypothetical protein B0H63DRAFT_490439 [Podospora didyma]|uniref:HTH psq-type domain-containing protein n=1 Tax=Podospora didyma TaxID=330526 RepID=A0AAE0N0M1_9PEZI|nr:hypothetical protein B0H63DRAFT_490439 [Podospora didyma]